AHFLAPLSLSEYWEKVIFLSNSLAVRSRAISSKLPSEKNFSSSPCNRKVSVNKRMIEGATYYLFVSPIIIKTIVGCEYNYLMAFIYTEHLVYSVAGNIFST